MPPGINFPGGILKLGNYQLIGPNGIQGPLGIWSFPVANSVLTFWKGERAEAGTGIFGLGFIK